MSESGPEAEAERDHGGPSLTRSGHSVKVRDALEGDLPAILAIHNANIAASTAIWDVDEVGIEERAAWFAARAAAGHPILVAEIDGEVAGYAGYGQWRPKLGYLHSVENSVYVDERFQRRGVARALLTALLERARESGSVHAMIAAIESRNTGSIALHEQFGFRIVGELPEVGRKFGLWMDLTLMQLTLPVPEPDPRLGA